jgi:hypothetical protein
MSIINLTPSQLRQAANLKEKIATLQKQLAALTGGEEVSAPVKASKPARKKISAAGIAKIRAAQKARWAKIKVEDKPAAKPAKKARKKLSAEVKAKMAAAAKARWAKIRAEKAAK